MGDASKSKPRINWHTIMLAVMGLILLPAMLVVGLRLAAALEGDKPAPSIVRSAPLSAEPRAPTFAEQVAAQSDLVGVLNLLRPRMRSSSGTEPDLGSEVLVQWSALRLTWQHLEALRSTSYARAKKDPDLETGNYICATGHIVQILAGPQFGFADLPRAPLVRSRRSS